MSQSFHPPLHGSVQPVDFLKTSVCTGAVPAETLALPQLSLGFQLQQMEEAELQQREANLTALAAIGPRRKRPPERPEGQVSFIFRTCFLVTGSSDL